MDMFMAKKGPTNPVAQGSTTISGTGIKTMFSFAVMGLLAIIPPVTPLSAIGMDVLGVFIGTVLLLSLVDTTWPAILSIALFSMTGVMSLEDIIAVSFGNWITMFVIMGFILTYALNHSGFTGRLTTFFLSSKMAKCSLGVLPSY